MPWFIEEIRWTMIRTSSMGSVPEDLPAAQASRSKWLSHFSEAMFQQAAVSLLGGGAKTPVWGQGCSVLEPTVPQSNKSTSRLIQTTYVDGTASSKKEPTNPTLVT